MIVAYVEGRPISRSSSSLISEASVYRAGALVECPSASISLAASASPSATAGSRRSRSSSSASGSSEPSTYAFRKPWKEMIFPEAVNSTVRPSDASPPTRTVTELPVASFICEATVRIQISS